MVPVVRAEDLLTRADVEAFTLDCKVDIDRAVRRATIEILMGMVVIAAIELAVSKLLF
jgi:hypothetical protein